MPELLPDYLRQLRGFKRQKAALVPLWKRQAKIVHVAYQHSFSSNRPTPTIGAVAQSAHKYLVGAYSSKLNFRPFSLADWAPKRAVFLCMIAHFRLLSRVAEMMRHECAMTAFSHPMHKAGIDL